jgi:hypothetical protein
VLLGLVPEERDLLGEQLRVCELRIQVDPQFLDNVHVLRAGDGGGVLHVLLGTVPQKGAKKVPEPLRKHRVKSHRGRSPRR